MTEEFETEEWAEFKRKCVRRYLRNVVYLRHKVAHHEAEIAELRSLADGLSSIDYSRDMVDTSPTADAIPNKVIEIQRRIEEGMAHVGEYVDALDELKRTLDSMDNQLHARVVRMHYVEEVEYEDIVKTFKDEDTPWSISSVKRFSGMGLDELYYLMPHEWRIPAYPADR